MVPQEIITKYDIGPEELMIIDMAPARLREAALDLLMVPYNHIWRQPEKRGWFERLCHPFSKPLYECRDANIVIALRAYVKPIIESISNSQLERFSILAWRGANYTFLIHIGETSPYDWMKLALLLATKDDTR